MTCGKHHLSVSRVTSSYGILIGLENDDMFFVVVSVNNRRRRTRGNSEITLVCRWEVVKGH